MERYLKQSAQKDDTRWSIDSQELLRQVDRKINQSPPAQMRSFQKKLVEQNDDEFDQTEQLEYLSFKEQTILKRLFNLRDEHKLFLNSLQKYQDQLICTVKDQMQKLTEICNTQLRDAENDLRLLLQEIQKNKDTLNSDSNCHIVQSPLKNKGNFYQELTNKIQELNQIISHHFEESQTYRTNNFQRQLNFSNFKESSYKKNTHQSPLQELDRFLQSKSSSKKKLQFRENPQVQDLNMFVECLKQKVNSYNLGSKKSSGIKNIADKYNNDYFVSSSNTFSNRSKRVTIENQLMNQLSSFRRNF